MSGLRTTTIKREIWPLFPKISSGKTRIGYNDAVKQALSFGWIDSTIRRIDDTYSAIEVFSKKSRQQIFTGQY
jgi:hypothetical protein